MTTIINNTAIEYLEDGRGPVILMLHGWGDSMATFDRLADQLATKFRVVRLDLPGHGRSQVPAEPWNLDHYVELVAAFIKKLGLDVELLVGHSFGGRIAIKGLADHRLRSPRTVLIASAGLRRSSPQRWPFMAIAKVGKWLTAVPPLRSIRSRLQAKLYRRAGSEYLDAGPLRPTFLNIVREDLSGAAQQIDIPALLIWGERDDATPLADGRRLAGLIPRSRLLVIPDASHFVHQEQPDRVATAIEQFIFSK
ncbi:MAG: alpha/beta hydrolase [Candidatus Kerfeldbacteria bacterium]|nr:alpha/beta hydrolase [Candidatus Kerfeldbacteria bacterium]